MLIVWTLMIAAATAHKVFESTEDIGPEAFQNVTTLYPIHQNTTNQTKENIEENQITEPENNNETSSKDDKSKLDATIWKIETAFADSNLETREKENVTQHVSDKNETKEFKPSQHLGNFYDEDNFQVTPTKASLESFVPMKKPAGFISNTDDFRSPFTKIPKQILQTHTQYPYKFETPILTRLKDPWRKDRPDNLDSKPTIESPVKIPAGGFYKYEDPFKDKPIYSGYEQPEYYNDLFKQKPLFPARDEDPYRDKPGSNEEYGLSYTEGGKEEDNALKKRVNPWEHFLQLVTAFLPVGLIISALTPSLVTIQHTGNTGTQGHMYPGNLLRRADPGAASDLPRISERCRRRLLCELHSDYYFTDQKSPHRRGRNCYKIHCEDTDALAKTLEWLLEYRKTRNRHNT